MTVCRTIKKDSRAFLIAGQLQPTRQYKQLTVWEYIFSGREQAHTDMITGHILQWHKLHLYSQHSSRHYAADWEISEQARQ